MCLKPIYLAYKRGETLYGQNGVIIDPNGYGYKNHIKAKLVSFYHHVPFWLFLYTFGGTPQKVGNSA